MPLPPLWSSLANSVSVAKLEPVKTARTVSKLLPIVSMNELGALTGNEHDAVHVHHTPGVRMPTASRGSPVSDVAPAFDPVAVNTPCPLSVNRLAKLSFVGRAMYVNAFGSVAVCVSGFVTDIVTIPAACAGVAIVIFVELTKTRLVGATPPIDTDTRLVKFVPKIAIGVPPAIGPDEGMTDEMVGGGHAPGVTVASAPLVVPPELVATARKW